MDKDNELIEKIKSELDNLVSAASRLKEAVRAEKTMLNRDVSIQRFEFTFELAWKLIKSINTFTGNNCFSPRDCFRIAAQNDLINDPLSWFEYLKQRNNTVHAYDEKKAEEVYSCLSQFFQDVEKLITAVKDKINDF